MDLTSVNNYVFVLLYSCFLLFILWGSAFIKFIMLANSYIHKKDISIVYVYHVNLVKLYTIYHRKMMLFFFYEYTWGLGFSAGQYGELLDSLLMTHPAEIRDWHGDLSHDMMTTRCLGTRRPRCVEHGTERWLWREVSIKEIKFLFRWLFRNT